MTRHALREWYGHSAGVAPLWLRLGAPGAIAAAWLGNLTGARLLLPFLVAPLAAAAYAAAYVFLRAAGLRVPLRRLKALDTLLLAVSAALAGGVVALCGAGPWVWLSPVTMLVPAWLLNWQHQGQAGRPSPGEMPEAPVFHPPAHGPVGAGYRSYDRSHTGVDLSLPRGSRVDAPAAGVVAHAGPLEQWGYAVLIDHGAGWSSLLAHLHRPAVKRGQRVSPGDLVGWSGSSGISTGPHLHAELRYRERPVDPAPLLAQSSPAGH